jgi:hypothetical protein
MSRTIFLQKINLGIKEFDAAIESVEKLRNFRPKIFEAANFCLQKKTKKTWYST